MVALDLPEQYTLPVSRSDWPELLAGRESLLPEGSIPCVLTEFGELFVTQIDGKVGMLQVSCFQYQVVAKALLKVRMVEAGEVLSDPWNRIAEVVAVSTNRVMTVADPLPRSTRRMYRLVTPQRN
jgi:hypothetical protein